MLQDKSNHTTSLNIINSFQQCRLFWAQSMMFLILFEIYYQLNAIICIFCHLKYFLSKMEDEFIISYFLGKSKRNVITDARLGLLTSTLLSLCPNRSWQLFEKLSVRFSNSRKVIFIKLPLQNLFNNASIKHWAMLMYHTEVFFLLLNQRVHF